MKNNAATTISETPLKDEWRITPPAIEREMARIAELLQKSIQAESRATTPQTTVTRREACAALIAACQP